MDERSFKIAQDADILHQFITQKSAILEKVKGTFLFPYLINMDYLIGKMENVMVTQDPIEELVPYLNTIEGINRTLQVQLNRENLIDWEVFKLDIHFSQTDWDSISKDKYSLQGQKFNFEELSIYLLLKFAGNNVDMLIFGIIDGKIIPQEKVQYFLDNDAKIKDTKITLGLI